jgi:hypothetical protein
VAFARLLFLTREIVDLLGSHEEEAREGFARPWIVSKDCAGALLYEDPLDAQPLVLVRNADGALVSTGSCQLEQSRAKSKTACSNEPGMGRVVH